MIYKIILVYSTTAHIHLYLHYKSEWHHGSNAIVSSSCQNLCCLRMQRQVFRVLPQSYHLQGRQRSAWIAKDMGAMLWFKGILGIFIVAPLSKPLASSNASTAPVRDTPLCTFTPTCASDGMTALKSTSRMPLALSQVPSKGTGTWSSQPGEDLRQRRLPFVHTVPIAIPIPSVLLLLLLTFLFVLLLLNCHYSYCYWCYSCRIPSPSHCYCCSHHNLPTLIP